MKKIFCFAVAMIATIGLLSGCMDRGYDDMSDVKASEVYGNNDLVEKNVISIADLKAKYPAMTQSRATAIVEEDLMLKLRVTGNDIGGNIYSFFSAVDEAGDAIFIYVYSGGLFGYLPVGQEILVDLKDLCVGANGTQPCIGGIYKTSSGNVYPKNLNNFIWQKHFKLLGEPDASKCPPTEYTASEFKTAWSGNKAKMAGQLVTLKGVTITEANGKLHWGAKSEIASEGDFGIERHINGLSSDYFVYTSTSAKFAGEVIPEGTVDITGVIVRYGNKAQIYMRSLDDCKVVNN